MPSVGRWVLTHSVPGKGADRAWPWWHWATCTAAPAETVTGGSGNTLAVHMAPKGECEGMDTPRDALAGYLWLMPSPGVIRGIRR